MKITIELSEAETKGIKAYLREFEDHTPDKKDIQVYIQGVVSCTINAPHEAVSDYIKKYTI